MAASQRRHGSSSDVGRRDEPPAVRAEGQGLDGPGVSPAHGERGAGVSVPQPHGAVVAAGGQPAAIRAEAHRFDGIALLSPGHGDRAAGRRLPQAQRVVLGDGSQPAAVGAEGHADGPAPRARSGPGTPGRAGCGSGATPTGGTASGAVSRIRRAAELLCNCRAAAAATRFARYNSWRAVSRWARAFRHCQTIPESPRTVTTRTAAVRPASIGRRRAHFQARPQTPIGRATIGRPDRKRPRSSARASADA